MVHYAPAFTRVPAKAHSSGDKNPLFLDRLVAGCDEQMKIGGSRREFLLAAGSIRELSGATSKPPHAGRAVGDEIRAEVRRRAERYVTARYLEVDYYRVRRRLAYPLPVASLSIPSISVPTLANYPWATWMLWALEERVHALGWAAEWFQEKSFADAASRDLAALSGWPKYCQFDQPDLSSAHAGRILWAAATKWRWVSEPLRRAILAACLRHAQEVAPEIDRFYGPVRSKEDLLALPPQAKLGNIALIGTVSAALTAALGRHPAAEVVNEKAQMVFETILDLRSQGIVEGVGYDGYMLDFVADWLSARPAAQRSGILGHPNLRQYLQESYMLGAPGAAQQVAQLSDVEAREMPFHYSAQAKLARLETDAVRDWHLRRWPLEWIRADALGAMHSLAGKLNGTAPPAGALDAHYAFVLRSGWNDNDAAVAISCHHSPMGHLQMDNGTLVIGARGQWIIADPGYQQYALGNEREFTLGPAAHNYPLLNGLSQSKKAGRRLRLDGERTGLLRATLELKDCYPAAAKAKSVARDVWLSGRDGVVVADQVQAEDIRTLAYHWHGHPEAQWCVREGWVLLHLSGADLWFTTPQTKLSFDKVERLAGSRGQLTLGVEMMPVAVVWWVFALAGAPPKLDLTDGGRAVRVFGKRFSV